jgi:hypothetical protein
MPFIDHRKNSRTNWGRDVEGRDSNPDRDDIRLGCLLRIADATELMAKRHTELIRERDEFERSKARWQANAINLERRLRGTRGALTRAQRRIAELQQELAAAKQAGTNASAD